MQWLTMTHAQRWHAHRHDVGRGHLYQGRFKSFVIQQDWHFLSVCRYVERNALRANLVDRAERWRWGSLWTRPRSDTLLHKHLATWPVQRPADWVEAVNEPQNEKELAALRQCRTRGQPYGEASWALSTAKKLGVESSLRPRGRPKKKQEPQNGF